jgi:hypothetical protein
MGRTRKRWNSKYGAFIVGAEFTFVSSRPRKTHYLLVDVTGKSSDAGWERVLRNLKLSRRKLSLLLAEM